MALAISGNNSSRIFNITAGEVNISHVTITGGNPGVVFDGGGILVNGFASLMLTSSIISGNTASSGGGLSVDAGSLSLINSTVNGNAAPFGGGINSNFSNVVLDGSTINGNSGGKTGGILSISSSVTLRNSYITANSEGGIRSISGSLTLDNTVVSGNTAPHTSGGGVLISTGSMSAVRSTIINNSAVSGGGISNNNGTLTLSAVSLSNNTAINWGGGMESFGQVAMTNVTIDNNSAGSGGGIFDNGGTEILRNCTISGNTATVQGGGTFNRGMLTLVNVTMHANSASIDGGGIFNFDGTVGVKNTILSSSLSGGNCSGVVASQGHNLSSDNTCGFTGEGDLVNTDPLLGPLQDNGGPTFTHALFEGSPAIDAGDNGGIPATDQRGYPRIWNGTVDIGAYEYGQRLVSVPSLNMWGMIVLALLAGIGAVCYLWVQRNPVI